MLNIGTSMFVKKKLILIGICFYNYTRNLSHIPQKRIKIINNSNFAQTKVLRTLKNQYVLNDALFLSEEQVSILIEGFISKLPSYFKRIIRQKPA